MLARIFAYFEGSISLDSILVKESFSCEEAVF